MRRRDFVKSLAAGFAIAQLVPDVADALADSLDALRVDLEAAPDDDAYWARVREEFSALDMVYLNSSTIGATPRSIVEALCGYIRRLESYPRGFVFSGFEEATLEDVRVRAAEFLGASRSEVTITRNTTEGMNMIADGIQLNPGDEVLTTDQEHPGGLTGWINKRRLDDIRITKMPMPREVESEAQILQLVEDHITSDTRVCSFCHIMTETGLQMPLAGIAQITRPKEILLVCDGAHGPGMLNVDVKALGVDTYASSSHKWMLAPKGSGLLYIRREVQRQIQPTMLSGGYQVYSGSTGTRNTPQIIAHGDTMTFHNTIGRDRVEHRVRQLQAYLRQRLAELPGVTPLVPDIPELSSGATSFAFAQGNANSLFQQLRARGIDVKTEPPNSMRISTHIFNSEADIDLLTDELKDLLGVSTAVGGSGGMLPQAAALRQNYPNPFNASTQIRFELPHDGNVRLEVLDAIGQVVAVPIRGWRSAGAHDLLWSGAGFASGLYFYRLVTEEDALTRKMELVK